MDCFKSRKAEGDNCPLQSQREADAGVPQGPFSMVRSDLGKGMNSERMDESL